MGERRGTERTCEREAVTPVDDLLGGFSADRAGQADHQVVILEKNPVETSLARIPFRWSRGNQGIALKIEDSFAGFSDLIANDRIEHRQYIDRFLGTGDITLLVFSIKDCIRVDSFADVVTDFAFSKDVVEKSRNAKLETLESWL